MGKLKDIYEWEGIRTKKSKLKGFEDDLRVVGEDEDEEEIVPDPQRGRHLQNLYTALRGSFEKNKFRAKSKNPSIINIFNKAAGKLNKVERETGAEIDDAIFVLAQFMKYDIFTYPGHLLGKAAIEIYEKKLEEITYTTYVPRKDDYLDRKILKHLCEVRRESEEEVIAKLKDAGIFSSAFIKKWGFSSKKRK